MTSDEERNVQRIIAQNKAKAGQAFLPRFGAVLASLMLVAVLMAGWKAIVDRHGAAVLQHPAVAIQEAVKAAQPLVDADLDHEAVREWLRKNLDDPQWQEVEWSPTVILEERHIREVNRLADEAEKGTEALLKADFNRQISILLESAANDAERKQLDQWLSRWNQADREAVGKYIRAKNLKRANGSDLFPFLTGKGHNLVPETEDVTEARTRFEGAKAAKPDRACRLRFRTRNLFGALTLCEYTFVIHDDKAYHDEDAAQYFPKTSDH